MKFFGSIILLFFLVSCNYFDNSPLADDVVVSVNGYSLSMNEVMDVVPNSSTIEDSTFIANSYVESWIKEHVVLNYAENFLSDDQKDFDFELTKYRNSLMIYAYETEFLKQNLDTMVTQEALNDYYKNNSSYFVLKENIVRVNYFILPDSLEDIKDFEKLFYDNDLQKSTELEQYCVNNNAKYYFGAEKWMYISDLKEKIPMDQHQENLVFQNKPNLVINKEGKLFFLKILEYDLKGNKSPLSLQASKIKDIILNQRKIETINKLHQDIYLQAKDNKLIKRNDEN